MFESVSLGAPENAIGFLFWRITSRYQREMDRALEHLDLTNLQFVCLALTAWLGRSGEATNQVQLSSFAGIHPMQLSQMLKALEHKGFVKRERSRVDSRAKEVSVTRKGLDRLRKSLPIAIEVQAKLFAEAGLPGGSLHALLLEVDERFVGLGE